MKQKFGFLCTMLLLSCLLAAPSFAEDAEEEVPVGTRLGSVYTTDIVTYIDGAPIASYNIGGTTVVSVSDLAGYGFQVEWDPETRWVTVTSAQRPGGGMRSLTSPGRFPERSGAATMPLTSGCSSMAMSWSMSITLAGG